MHTASKQSHHAPHLRIYRLKEDASLRVMFNPLCSSMNQQLFKKNFCNQNSHYENYGRFNGSHHVPTNTLYINENNNNNNNNTTKSTLFVVSKDEWDTKEGPGSSMKNALYVQRHGERHLSG